MKKAQECLSVFDYDAQIHTAAGHSKEVHDVSYNRFKRGQNKEMWDRANQ